MKLNWKTLKVVLALVIIIVTLFWSGDSIRSRSYAGTDLNFPVGQGVVTVKNPSADAVPVQLVGAGTRAFSVASKVEGLAGAAVKQGSGSASTYSRDFALIPGVNEFTIVRGTDVKFVANTPARLDATVQPLDEGSARTTLFVAGVIILGALYYISRTTGYTLSRILNRQEVPVPALQPAADSAVANQGRAARSYGDNRAEPSQ